MGQVAAGHGLQALGQGGDGDSILFGGAGLLGLDADALLLGGGARWATASASRRALAMAASLKAVTAEAIWPTSSLRPMAGTMIEVSPPPPTHGRGHRQQGLAQQVGQHEGHGGGDDQGQNDDPADQHHPHRLGDGVLNLAIDAALLRLLFFDQGFQRVLCRADILVCGAFATDHGHGLTIGRGVGDQHASGLDHVPGPFGGGGASGADLILAGAVQLRDPIQALAEIRRERTAAPDNRGHATAGSRDSCSPGAPDRICGLGLALHGGGAHAVHARLLQCIDLHEDRAAHGDDRQDDHGEGRH
ncbi:hypothetical protein [Brevundimonas pondensis]|uniref:Uncharacterized protein n=1 Tax=Brevundimonas pondensis TaxID=2774189 RepID=A0ABX7SHJ4_9CAUL|nr:hypothetical protein [Brevundimonas pondensis]QTC87116.1 hypothetical protein IFE19_13465 [Brevundimonas pondensis]